MSVAISRFSIATSRAVCTSHSLQPVEHVEIGPLQLAQRLPAVVLGKAFDRGGSLQHLLAVDAVGGQFHVQPAQRLADRQPAAACRRLAGGCGRNGASRGGGHDRSAATQASCCVSTSANGRCGG